MLRTLKALFRALFAARRGTQYARQARAAARLVTPLPVESGSGDVARLARARGLTAERVEVTTKLGGDTSDGELLDLYEVLCKEPDGTPHWVQLWLAHDAAAVRLPFIFLQNLRHAEDGYLKGRPSCPDTVWVDGVERDPAANYAPPTYADILAGKFGPARDGRVARDLSRCLLDPLLKDSTRPDRAAFRVENGPVDPSKAPPPPPSYARVDEGGDVSHYEKLAAWKTRARAPGPVGVPPDLAEKAAEATGGGA